MSDYWKNREQTQRAKDVMDEMRYNAELKRMYMTMMDECQDEIDRFYGKYATDEGITLADAKKRVEQMDIEAYERMAKKMVAEKDFSKEANEAMRLYNTTMKINRLEYLKSKIGLNLVDGYDDLQKYFEKKITSRTVKEFERMAGILGDTVTVTDVKRRAEAILNSSFYNAKFSDRIWSNQDMLRNEIDRQLQSGMIRGVSSRELGRNIASAFNVSLADAQRLMATEMRRAQTEAAKIAYEESGVIEYQYIVTNYKACPVCKEMDGKVFLVSKMEPGENAPPLHPRCHCTTGPYGDDDEYNDWLNALESGKTTEQWRAENPNNKLFGDYKPEPEIKHRTVDGTDIVEQFEWDKDNTTTAIREVIKTQGFDGLPQVLDGDEFEKAVKESSVLLKRGYTAPTAEILEVYKNELRSGEWYVDCNGGSAFGKGMYTAGGNPSDQRAMMVMDITAEGYSQKAGAVGIVETMTISSDARIITYKQLEEIHHDYRMKIQNEGSRILSDISQGKVSLDEGREQYERINKNSRAFLEDVGTFAAAKGYDAILEEGSCYYIILNRTKLIVKGENR